MSEETGSFEVNGRRYSLPTSLTVGEMADAERYFGVEFGKEEAATSIRMASALIWISVKREDATVTVEDIRELPSAVFESFLGGDASPPDLSEDSSASSESSGAPSDPDGDTLESPQATGNHSSDTGSDSVLLTSRT